MLQHRSDCCMEYCVVLSCLSLAYHVIGTNNSAKQQKMKKDREGKKILVRKEAGLDQSLYLTLHKYTKY